MTKDQIIQQLADAYEAVIATAMAAGQGSAGSGGDTWGPREMVAHLAGWEVMATVRVPRVAAGMRPIEFADEAQNAVMNDAINATIVAMVGDQSLEAVCEILRKAYQQEIATLRTLDAAHFQPGKFVYERTKSAIEHCHEHSEEMVPGGAAAGRTP